MNDGEAQENAAQQQAAKYTRELRRTVDKLRMENQKLHAELHQARSWTWSYFTARLFSRARHVIGQRTRVPGRHEIAKRIRILGRHVTGRRTTDERPSENTPQAGRYKPYEVRMRMAPEQHRPRVLHVIANFYTGGSSQLVVDLIEHLGHRFQQSVITRDLPPTPAYTGVQLIHCPRITSVDQALSHLRSSRPDFLHVHFLGHHGNAYSEEDWQWYHHLFRAAEKHGYDVLENLNIPVQPYISDSVRRYVHVSDYVRQRFAPVDARNVTVYPGSDLTFFSRDPDYDIPDDCIGMVYRLEKDKLNEQSIEVFIETVRRRPATKVLIVGGGRYLEYYRQRVRQEGLADAFSFTGYVAYSDLPSYYERMSLFVAPVHSESFGQVSPFAMGMSLPVVGYRTGALEEITGDRSLLAPPGDYHELARIITSLLDDRERRIRIGSFNRERALRSFSVEAMIDQYAGLYQDMLVTEDRDEVRLDRGAPDEERLRRAES